MRRNGCGIGWEWEKRVQVEGTAPSEAAKQCQAWALIPRPKEGQYGRSSEPGVLE